MFQLRCIFYRFGSVQSLELHTGQRQCEDGEEENEVSGYIQEIPPEETVTSQTEAKGPGASEESVHVSRQGGSGESHSLQTPGETIPEGVVQICFKGKEDNPLCMC